MTIEISNQNAPPALREALDSAYLKRDEARGNGEQAATTLTRAQRLSAVAADKVAELEQELAKLEAAQAKRLEAAIVAGGPTAVLPADIAMEGLASELSSAKLHAGIAARALESIKSTHTQRQAELQAAEATLIATVDEILDAEDIEIARQLSHHLHEALRIGKELLFATIAREVYEKREAPTEVTAALEKLDYPMLDRRHISINMWKQGDQAAYAQRAERRAEMIAGESAPVADVAA